MLNVVSAFSGFSVDDLAKAKTFYGETLGLTVEEQEGMGLQIHLPHAGQVFVYPKENHEPATYTVLNLGVEDIDEAVDALTELGVSFEHYEGMHQDHKGVARPPKDSNYGPSIAWFKDPAGNILSVLESKE